MTSKLPCISVVDNYRQDNSTHTTVLFIIIFVFIFTVYGTSPKIGSVSAMHDLLANVAVEAPVSGNAHGSYLTIRSKNGLIFGVINVIGNFATVFQDQAVSQGYIGNCLSTSLTSSV